MFGDELVIGSVRAQAHRLNEIITQLEADRQWRNHRRYYADEMYQIEKNLRKIRKVDVEPPFIG